MADALLVGVAVALSQHFRQQGGGELYPLRQPETPSRLPTDTLHARLQRPAEERHFVRRDTLPCDQFILIAQLYKGGGGGGSGSSPPTGARCHCTSHPLCK